MEFCQKLYTHSDSNLLVFVDDSHVKFHIPDRLQVDLTLLKNFKQNFMINIGFKSNYFLLKPTSKNLGTFQKMKHALFDQKTRCTQTQKFCIKFKLQRFKPISDHL